MKKQYQKPLFTIVELQHKEFLQSGSPSEIRTFSGNTDFDFAGSDDGYEGDAR